MLYKVAHCAGCILYSRVTLNSYLKAVLQRDVAGYSYMYHAQN